jgi:homoaconitase/3-isopropylmalate dehydratase large subunit
MKTPQSCHGSAIVSNGPLQTPQPDDTIMASRPRTLYEKIWDAHVVEVRDDGTALIYIDRHLVHEVTSPQAFEALRVAGRPVRRPELTLAVPDHNLPTTARLGADGAVLPIADPESAAQLAALEVNAPAYGIRYIPATAKEQGIVHVVGPEQGFSLPVTVGSARSPSGSAPAKLSTCWRRRRCCSSNPNRWKCG